MIPETIDLGNGFVLERARPADAPWIARAVGESLEHLRPYLEWAASEQAVESTQRARLVALEDSWARAEQFGFLVRREGEPAVLGSTGLHWQRPDRYGGGAIEIGYWIHARWCNRGLATRAADALTTVAFGLTGVERVVIRCDASNLASAAVARKLGFTLRGTEDAPVKAPAETGTFLVWIRTRTPDAAAGSTDRVHTMDAADELLAIEQIKQLKARYFRTMDTKDWDGYANVYAPDAVLDVSGESAVPDDQGVIRGNTNIAEYVRSQVDPVLTVHHGHMPEIEITSPTTARGVWSMEDMLRWPEGGPIGEMHGYGHYHETYEKVDGQWRIASCTLTRLRVDFDV